MIGELDEGGVEPEASTSGFAPVRMTITFDLEAEREVDVSVRGAALLHEALEAAGVDLALLREIRWATTRERGLA